MNHRRRGADFSHLLESFRNTSDCGSDLDSSSQRISSATSNLMDDATYDGNRRMNSKTSMETDASGTCSFKSTILAGHVASSDSQASTENSYRTAQSGSIVGGSRSRNASGDSWRPEPPSLMNRAIEIHFEPQSVLDLTQSTSEPRSSGEMNKNINTLDANKSTEDARDTNYNLKNDSEEENFVTGAEFRQRIMDSQYTPKHHSTPEISSSKQNWAVLSRLDNILDPSGNKNVKTKEKILKRLSQEFIHSPRTFTERLVTIIDETETEHALETGETSGVDLSRMTKEFRRMCKYIQDESMPDWAPSLCTDSILGKSKYAEDSHVGKAQIPETIEESLTISSRTDFTTPRHDDSAGRKIYRKTPLNIFKKTFRESKAIGSPGSPNSTRDFENLEKYVEASCSPKSRSGNLRRSLSSPDISEPSREKLTIKCEELLRSLDETTPLDFDTFDSHRGQKARESVVEKPLIKNNTNIIADIASKYANLNTEEINEDELSKSLLIELEKQRQRCLDTAKLMQEIEKDATNKNEDYSKELNNHGIDPGKEFLKTIRTCFAYQQCRSALQKNKKRSEASSADSGIDARSISRTLHASSKKSYGNEISGKSYEKTIPKNQGKKEFLAKRSNSTKVGTGALKKTYGKTSIPTKSQQRLTRNLDKPIDKQSLRKKSPTFLCVRKSLGRSRSPSVEKRVASCQSPCMNRYFRTPETKRVDENRVETPVRNINIENSSPEIITITSSRKSASPAIRKQTQIVRSPSKTPQSASRSARSPRRYQISSAGVSPLMTNRSKERVAKIGTYETDKRAECSPVSTKTVNSPRRQFFVTPGRSVPVVKKTKKTFFPNIPDDMASDNISPRVLKSLHAPGIFRLGYETVISPVRMYIHATDVNFIQNNHEKKNEMLLTPSKAAASTEKLKFKLSKSSTSRDSPRKNRLFANEEDYVSRSDNDENVKPDFALPKATYNLPEQVHMVNECPTEIRGARTRELLQSMQNRLVIRHEGKRFGKYVNEVPESSIDSPDMSIHVQKPAQKTNYASHWK